MEGLLVTGATLSLDARSDVMETAIEAGHVHGIGYWADVQQTKDIEIEGKKRIGWMWIYDAEGGAEPDAAPDSPYFINTDRKPGYVGINGEHIQRAVAKMLTDPELAKDWAGRLLDDDGLDGPLADAIIQVACFGKLIYG